MVQRSRTRTNGVVLLGIVLVAAASWGLQFFFNHPADPHRAEVEKATSSGEKFDLRRLAIGESMVISHLSRGHMRTEAWTYVIEGGDAVRLVVLEHEATWAKDYRLTAGKVVLSEALTLTRTELDAVALYWAGVRVPWSEWERPHYFDTFEVEYRRGGKTVGEEKFVAVGDSYFRWTQPYEYLPPEYVAHFSPQQWKALRSFRRLLRDRRDASLAEGGQK
jgi:hypothetical protein